MQTPVSSISEFIGKEINPFSGNLPSNKLKQPIKELLIEGCTECKQRIQNVKSRRLIEPSIGKLHRIMSNSATKIVILKSLCTTSNNYLLKC